MKKMLVVFLTLCMVLSCLVMPQVSADPLPDWPLLPISAGREIFEGWQRYIPNSAISGGYMVEIYRDPSKNAETDTSNPAMIVYNARLGGYSALSVAKFNEYKAAGGYLVFWMRASTGFLSRPNAVTNNLWFQIGNGNVPGNSSTISLLDDGGTCYVDPAKDNEWQVVALPLSSFTNTHWPNLNGIGLRRMGAGQHGNVYYANLHLSVSPNMNPSDLPPNEGIDKGGFDVVSEALPTTLVNDTTFSTGMVKARVPNIGETMDTDFSDCDYIEFDVNIGDWAWFNANFKNQPSGTNLESNYLFRVMFYNSTAADEGVPWLSYKLDTLLTGANNRVRLYLPKGMGPTSSITDKSHLGVPEVFTQSRVTSGTKDFSWANVGLIRFTFEAGSNPAITEAATNMVTVGNMTKYQFVDPRQAEPEPEEEFVVVLPAGNKTLSETGYVELGEFGVADTPFVLDDDFKIALSVEGGTSGREMTNDRDANKTITYKLTDAEADSALTAFDVTTTPITKTVYATATTWNDAPGEYEDTIIFVAQRVSIGG